MELNLLISGAFSSTYEQLAPMYMATSGNTVISKLSPSMGSSADAVPARLQRNEAADVVIMVGEDLQKLEADGEIVAGSKVDLARASIAMAVRAGSHKPDINTRERLAKVLLNAASIGYSESASGHYVQSELLKTLGVYDKVHSRARMISGKPVGDAVADGEVEVGFQQMAELLPIAGIAILGLLPQDIQHVTTISAGISSQSSNKSEAAAFIRFLVEDQHFPVLKQNGLQPPQNEPRTSRDGVDSKASD